MLDVSVDEMENIRMYNLAMLVLWLILFVALCCLTSCYLMVGLPAALQSYSVPPTICIGLHWTVVDCIGLYGAA